MTQEEIRKLCPNEADSTFANDMLQEIACQLAQLNENLCDLRNHQMPFPVQIEPGSYPITVTKS